MRFVFGARALRAAALIAALVAVLAAGCAKEGEEVEASVQLKEFERGLEARYSLPKLVDGDAAALVPGLDAYVLTQTVCRVSERGLYAAELYFFEVEKESEAEEVRLLLETRRDNLVANWGETRPEQRALVENAYIVNEGRYVIMLFAEQGYEMLLDFEEARSVAAVSEP